MTIQDLKLLIEHLPPTMIVLAMGAEVQAVFVSANALVLDEAAPAAAADAKILFHQSPE